MSACAPEAQAHRGAWYLAPEALAILAKMRAAPPHRERHFQYFTQTHDEWTAYSGGGVSALNALSNRRFAELESAGADADTLRAHTLASPQRVICAALHEYPVPCFRSDMAEIDAMAAEIEAALVGEGRKAA